MEVINSIAAFLQKLFQWWFVVMPWEQAIHIRKGNIVKLLGEGLYLKIPFIDQVYIQTTRMRMVDLAAQTISTRDGSTITIKSALGYGIADVMKLYNTLFHPEMTLGSMVQGFVGEYVRSNDISEITPASIEAVIKSKIDPSDYGLKDVSIRVTTFAVVKTFRLIQDISGLWEGLNMDPKK